jgi:endonuclease-3
MKPTPALKKRVAQVLRRLRKAYPNAGCELNFSNPLELAVAAILSAQCTDKRVNQITPSLFKKHRTTGDWAKTPQNVLETEIRSTGFFRNKAKNIRALCAELEKSHEGHIPNDFDVLITLPGIGRKTANLLISTAYGKPGIIVDTHFKRLSNRLGFTDKADPDKIEFDLKALLPKKDWSNFSHCMVFHGRRCCFARKPNCPECPVKDLCPSFGKV